MHTPKASTLGLPAFGLFTFGLAWPSSLGSLGRKLAVCVSIVISASSTGVGQKISDTTQLDTALVRPNRPEDTLSRENWTTAQGGGRRLGSPTVALFKSALVPGWGQVSNHAYLKAGLVVAVEGLFLHQWLQGRSETDAARVKFENARDSELPGVATLYDDYRNERYARNLNAWLLGTAVFLSMFDAYTDAHLRGFPESSIAGATIHAGLRPDFGLGGASVVVIAEF